MRRVLPFLSALVLVAVSAAPLFAQGEQSGAIRGRLSSSDGLSLPGAVVTVASPSLQGDRTAVADVNGVYSIPGLPPGEYTVHVAMPGFAVADLNTRPSLADPTP
jgi:hypothetical protein